MKRLLVVLLFVLVILPSPIISQTINVSLLDWEMLRTELSISKNCLSKLNKEVKKLEESLEKARLEQQNSRVSIDDSQEKIEDLERHLAIAVQRRDQLQSIVNSLENQSIELSRSLKDTQKILTESEEKHIENVKKLAAKYENRLLVKNLVIGGLVTIVVVETIVFLIKMVD